MACPRKPHQLVDLDCRSEWLCELDCPLRKALDRRPARSSTHRICAIPDSIDHEFVRGIKITLETMLPEFVMAKTI